MSGTRDLFKFERCRLHRLRFPSYRLRPRPKPGARSNVTRAEAQGKGMRGLQYIQTTIIHKLRNKLRYTLKTDKEEGVRGQSLDMGRTPHWRHTVKALPDISDKTNSLSTPSVTAAT